MIKCALAVNQQNKFTSRHFGDADKYLIFTWEQGEFVFLHEEPNRNKNLDEHQEHGSQKKGKAME